MTYQLAHLSEIQVVVKYLMAEISCVRIMGISRKKRAFYEGNSKQHIGECMLEDNRSMEEREGKFDHVPYNLTLISELNLTGTCTRQIGLGAQF